MFVMTKFVQKVDRTNIFDKKFKKPFYFWLSLKTNIVSKSSIFNVEKNWIFQEVEIEQTLVAQNSLIY